jgi:hypothetical protein
MQELVYSFRPNLFSAEKTIRVERGELVVEQKKHTRRIPLADIQSVRLFAAPVGTGADAYFCSIVPRAGTKLVLRSSSYAGASRFADRSADYAAFVLPFIDKVAAANSEARFLTGQSRGAWWAYVITMACLVPMLPLSLVFAFADGFNWSGLFAFVALLSYLPLMWRALGRGAMRPLDIHRIDRSVLPL